MSAVGPNPWNIFKGVNFFIPGASNLAATTSHTTMKKLISVILPIIALAGTVGLTKGMATPARGAEFGTVDHTSNRFCGRHCHHHGHYWTRGGCTFHCCGHE